MVAKRWKTRNIWPLQESFLGYLSYPLQSQRKSKREQQKYHSGGFQSLHKLAIAVVHNHHTPWILSLQNQQHTRATNRIKHLTHFLKLGLLVMWDGVHGRRRIEVTCLDLLNCSFNLCNSQGLAPWVATGALYECTLCLWLHCLVKSIPIKPTILQ